MFFWSQYNSFILFWLFPGKFQNNMMLKPQVAIPPPRRHYLAPETSPDRGSNQRACAIFHNIAGKPTLNLDLVPHSFATWAH